MTIAVAWVRTINGCEELVFVTDSRLSGDGRTFDACPKVMTLPRSDCAIAFAGYTGHAYPMMQQLALAIDAHAPLRRRSMDLPAMRSHALKIFDSMSELILSSQRLSTPVSAAPEAEFLFGGYSWIKKKFEIWAIRYNVRDRRFVAEPAHWVCIDNRSERIVIRRRPDKADARCLGKLAFAGDQAPLAKEKLIERLARLLNANMPKFDWEPFEVVRDMLRDPHHSETIGGAPQIVKVYQYMDAAPLGVYWPKKSDGIVHLQGRPCLGYERIDRFVLDPDTLRSSQTLPRRAAVRQADSEPLQAPLP
jgi:hypothetical protein